MDENKKLRKMISTGALSVALISWYTTANGLHVYVFKHIWQAYVISAALQGVLFSLSIKGVDLLVQFKGQKKKIALILAWVLLLSISSIFSYIYISGDVYTDKLLREDAQRILNTYCLEENYKLLSISNELLNSDKNGIEFELNEYVKMLAKTENGVEFSQDDKKQIDDLNGSLELYNNENSDFVNTTFLSKYMEDFSKGKNTDKDIAIIKEEVENIINVIDQRVKDISNEIESKEKTASEYQERLSGFRDTTSEAYINLTNDLDTVKVEISSLRTTRSSLNDEKESVNKVNTIVKKIKGGMESTLYNYVLDLRTEMNAEKIEINNVQNTAEEIYNILLENNIKSDDPKLTGYSKFRSDLKKYASVIKAQQVIEREIQLLYDLTNTTKVNFNVTDDKVEEENLEKDMELEESSNVKQEKNSINNDLLADEDDWNSYWRTRLNCLKYSVEILHSGGMNSDTIGELLTSIDVRERLYLSDLNDFERAVSLLFGKNPKHPHKTLLLFSFFFSFGIDLFSVLMSWLLFLLKSNES